MLEKVSIGFASLGFGPNFWTWMGLFLSIISAIMFSLHSPSIGANWYTSTVLGGIFLLIAGFFDALDGAIARVTNKTSALGGFLDSIIDKVSEIIIFVGILIGNYTNPVLVLVTLSMAILVSYTRARAESVGVDLKGKGIAERAERIIILAILAFIPFRDNISVALWIISIISIITVLQRLKIVSEIFGTPLFSVQTLSQIFKREDMSNRDYSQSSNRSSFTTPSNGQSPSSTSLKTSSNVKQIETRPEPRKEIKPETKTSTLPKADFIDKTDPNETGRNVAQLIFEQENEDKKMGKKSNTTTTAAAESSTSSTTASTANLKKQGNNTSNTTSTTSTSSTTKPNTTNTSKEEVNDSTTSQQ
ncbi:MAG: CDP-alcohol phosphatidyltransferase family protein [Candidatus Nitrosocosmicus sp.]